MKEIEEALEQLRLLSEDKELTRIYELRQKAIRDEKAAISYAKEHQTKRRNERRNETAV